MYHTSFRRRLDTVVMSADARNRSRLEENSLILRRMQDGKNKRYRGIFLYALSEGQIMVFLSESAPSQSLHQSCVWLCNRERDGYRSRTQLLLLESLGCRIEPQSPDPQIFEMVIQMLDLHVSPYLPTIECLSWWRQFPDLLRLLGALDSLI